MFARNVYTARREPRSCERAASANAIPCSERRPREAPTARDSSPSHTPAPR